LSLLLLFLAIRLHASETTPPKYSQVLDKFAATSKRLSSETDRLNNDLKHIERDEELVADEQKELEDQIHAGTMEFEEKCTVARLVHWLLFLIVACTLVLFHFCFEFFSEKLDVVNKRIDDLKKQVSLVMKYSLICDMWHHF
jgi:chromatin segregation and condensation protein Rec8/ScpA/Scc1 (kleisin family)